MKKVKGLICVAVAAIMLFALTACNSTFSGNFKKEATAEEIAAITQDVKNAAGDSGAEVMFEDKTMGIAASVELELKTNSQKDGAQTLKIKSEQQSAVSADDKVQLSSKSEMKVNDKSFKTQAYSKDGDFYLAVNDKKVKIGTALSGSLGIDLSEIANSMGGNSYLTEAVDDLIAFSAEELAAAGVKVYIDSSDEFTKIKYAISAKAAAEMEGVGETAVEIKDYYVILVLDADKKLYGIKVKCDVSMNVNSESMEMKMEGEIAKTDKEVKYPSFNGYEDATAESLTELFKEMGEIF